MPNLLTLISIGVHVRACGEFDGFEVGQRGIITDILLWTDSSINQSPNICIDWFDDYNNVICSGVWNMQDFCPHGGKIASMGLMDKTQDEYIKFNRKRIREGMKPIW